MTRLAEAWMTAPETVKLMAALGEARFVGGAVRNALLGQPVGDVDIATPLPPAEVCTRLERAGVKWVPTGIEHGTITAVVSGKPFEVTTLRRDVETDGRRAVVAFTADWAEDAKRRDFTVNALYAAADGEVFDFVGGLDDLKAHRVRFVGDAVQRIREDYLRILRLFRFHAWYGRGPLDAAALAAAANEKHGLNQLSGERIAKEMLKLLAAVDPVPVLAAMAGSGILAEMMNGAPGTPRLKGLVAADAALSLEPDAILRLAALLSGAEAPAIAARWKLSNHQRDRLFDLVACEAFPPGLVDADAAKLLYRLGPQRFRDRVRLGLAAAPENAPQGRALLARADAWRRPVFPLTGKDVLKAGVPAGPAVGRVLDEVGAWWIDSGFPSDAHAVHEALHAAIKKVC